MDKILNFQELIFTLSQFWAKQGCTIHHGYDLEVGAGTFNPTTFLRCLGPEPYRAAYAEPCRRPKDGRYGENPNRLQHYFQYQVIFKPSPEDIQDLYLQSLEAIGLDLNSHDIRFVHDDWEAPTQGAWGLGWEVWIDGMEVTQFTYFQAFAGIAVKPVTAEITYGLERLAMYLQRVDHYSKLIWNDGLTYGDIYKQNEFEGSQYNFIHADVSMWFRHFDDFEKEANHLIKSGLPLPAYDFVIKASNAFNVLDARGVISTTERTGYIARIRELSKLIAEAYIESREKQGYPLLPLKNSSCDIPEATLKFSSRQADNSQISALEGLRADYLIEIGSEELPATFVPIGCANLEKALKLLFKNEEIPFESIQTYGTPRRISAIVKGLGLAKPAKIIEKKGPPISSIFNSAGILTAAGEGFFKSINHIHATLQEIQAGHYPALSVKDLKGVDYLYASIEIVGELTGNIIAAQMAKLILSIDFPKKMRWGDLDISYARPLRWIVSLLGDEIISFELAGITSGRDSWGHRQLSPQSFPIASPGEYLSKLKEHYVMVDIEERAKNIYEQLDQIANQVNGVVIAKERVLPQVLHLVEWPMLTTASFDSNFLKAPREVLISEMVEHQKYFPIGNADGTLKNLFIITANNTPSEQIRNGNKKALSSRLADGVFLYEQDLKKSLDDFNEKLKHVTFQKDLGTVYEKVDRIGKNAEVLHHFMPICPLDKLKRAAHLCKADLASDLVNEFPELQGIIGKYYAVSQAEDAEVATAIDEHWMPRGENAPLPETNTGILLSLSDKIDNLISCFTVNLKPTSSSDPYALRRQVLGIVKILIKGKFHLPLQAVLKRCFEIHPIASKRPDQETLINEIVDFFAQRIKTVFLDYGFNKDEIEASLSNQIDDIYDIYCKVQALHDFRASSGQFKSLFEVYKRARGQLIDQKNYEFSTQLLKEPSEIDLNHSLGEVEKQFERSLDSSEYAQAYLFIAHLQGPLANLFDKVKILADDLEIRQNRIALLQRVFKLFARLLDFSKIQDH